jgi:IrrE N-terminal-like domain
MELFDASLLARRMGDEPRTMRLLAEALQAESAAADSVAENLSLEPTRSVLHRSAASIALQLRDIETAKRYAKAGLEIATPAEIRQELESLYEDVLTLEALQRDYRLKAPDGLTRVQQIRRRFTHRAPVDISGLAAALGVNVWQGTLGTNAGEIFRDLKSGGFSGYSIRVNASDPPVRKRFTAAHELAHFLRHRNRFTNRLIDDRMYRSGLGSGVEAEANRLAADLLMPRRLLRQFRLAGITSPKELAKMFNVSVEAIKLRIGIKPKR